MKVVMFDKILDGYRVGDCASFDDKVADKIIEAGYGQEIQLESTKIEDPNSKKK